MGKRPLEQVPEREPAKVTDLMAALKASVEAARTQRSSADQQATEPAKRRKAS